MANAKKLIAIFSLMAIVLTFTACNDEKIVYGQITKISESEITIATGSYDTAAAKAAASKKESDDKQDPGKSAGGKANETASANSVAEEVPGFTSDGQSATYTLSDNINIENLKTGLLVKLTLKKDTVEAVELVNAAVDQAGEGVESDTGMLELNGIYTVDASEQSSSKKDYTASAHDQNTVLITNKGIFSLSDSTLTKTGDTSNEDESNFYGINAIFAAAKGSIATIKNTTLSSSSSGSNAIFSTGRGSKITANDVKIYTTGNSSKGVNATYGGTAILSDSEITTKGAHCAPVATGQGKGTLKITNTTVKSEGKSSPCIFSAGNISAKKLTGNATGSQIAVIEGKNSITLNHCTLQGAGKQGLMFYQRTSSEDADEGTAALTAKDSSLTTISTGPMFYVTNTNAKATLENTSLFFTSEVLIKAAGNSTTTWGKKGENGGDIAFTGIKQKLEGDIECDNISQVALKLTKKSSLKGAVNAANTAKLVTLSLDKDSKWSVTKDSYVTAFANKDKKCNNIKSNGRNIYYDKDNQGNSWLKGKTVNLPGGGKLTPAS